MFLKYMTLHHKVSHPKGCNELSFDTEMVMNDFKHSSDSSKLESEKIISSQVINTDTTESIDDEMDFKIDRISDFEVGVVFNDENNQTKHDLSSESDSLSKVIDCLDSSTYSMEKFISSSMKHTIDKYIFLNAGTEDDTDFVPHEKFLKRYLSCDTAAQWNRSICLSDAEDGKHLVSYARKHGIKLRSRPKGIDYDICCNCYEISKNKITMTLDNGIYMCYTCGYTKKYLYDNEKYNVNSQTHNISNNSLMLFRIFGPDKHRYQQSLLRTSSNYKNYRRGSNIREFLSLNKKTDEPLPERVLTDAANLFTNVQDAGNIMRADFRRGVWGAFIQFECIRAGITKKPKQIAKFVNVSEKYLSKGDREVRRWHEEHLIDVPIRSNPIPDFINQYFDILSIDQVYKQFVIDIIRRVKIKKIRVYSSSNPSTCVVGVIWLLICQLKLNISHDDIIKHCKISKSTYITYYKLIIANEKALRKPFRRHNIPIPALWEAFKPKRMCTVRRRFIRSFIKVPKTYQFD